MNFLNEKVKVGNMVFENYMWCEVNGEKMIYSCSRKRLLRTGIDGGCVTVDLSKDGQVYHLALNDLKAGSFGKVEAKHFWFF